MLDDNGRLIKKPKVKIKCRCCQFSFFSYHTILNQMCRSCLKHGEYYNHLEGCPVAFLQKKRLAEWLEKEKKKRGRK